jgi:hypothetical protein
MHGGGPTSAAFNKVLAFASGFALQMPAGMSDLGTGFGTGRMVLALGVTDAGFADVDAWLDGAF